MMLIKTESTSIQAQPSMMSDNNVDNNKQATTTTSNSSTSTGPSSTVGSSSTSASSPTNTTTSSSTTSTSTSSTMTTTTTTSTIATSTNNRHSPVNTPNILVYTACASTVPSHVVLNSTSTTAITTPIVDMEPHSILNNIYVNNSAVEHNNNNFNTTTTTTHMNNNNNAAATTAGGSVMELLVKMSCLNTIQRQEIQMLNHTFDDSFQTLQSQLLNATTNNNNMPSFYSVIKTEQQQQQQSASTAADRTSAQSEQVNIATVASPSNQAATTTPSSTTTTHTNTTTVSPSTKVEDEATVSSSSTNGIPIRSSASQLQHTVLSSSPLPVSAATAVNSFSNNSNSNSNGITSVQSRNPFAFNSGSLQTQHSLYHQLSSSPSTPLVVDFNDMTLNSPSTPNSGFSGAGVVNSTHVHGSLFDAHHHSNVLLAQQQQQQQQQRLNNNGASPTSSSPRSFSPSSSSAMVDYNAYNAVNNNSANNSGVSDQSDQEILQKLKSQYTETTLQQAKISKKRKGYPKHITAILNQWYDEHRAYPYPSQTQKEHLSSLTGLTMIQLNNWFSNTRLRTKRKEKKEKDGVANVSGSSGASSPINSLLMSANSPTSAAMTGGTAVTSPSTASPTSHNITHLLGGSNSASIVSDAAELQSQSQQQQQQQQSQSLINGSNGGSSLNVAGRRVIPGAIAIPSSLQRTARSLSMSTPSPSISLSSSPSSPSSLLTKRKNSFVTSATTRSRKRAASGVLPTRGISPQSTSSLSDNIQQQQQVLVGSPTSDELGMSTSRYGMTAALVNSSASAAHHHYLGSSPSQIYYDSTTGTSYYAPQMMHSGMDMYSPANANPTANTGFTGSFNHHPLHRPLSEMSNTQGVSSFDNGHHQTISNSSITMSGDITDLIQPSTNRDTSDEVDVDNDHHNDDILNSGDDNDNFDYFDDVMHDSASSHFLLDSEMRDDHPISLLDHMEDERSSSPSTEIDEYNQKLSVDKLVEDAADNIDSNSLFNFLTF